ncbi:MAG: hypothetical protein WBN71_07135 [Acidimicrobiia bacterium]
MQRNAKLGSGIAASLVLGRGIRVQCTGGGIVCCRDLLAGEMAALCGHRVRGAHRRPETPDGRTRALDTFGDAL